eukprot:m.461409 g.461409  ORF g.461409 m.461409 type:complete len:260 (-) comp22298_c0_seq1:966-1745(-)
MAGQPKDSDVISHGRFTRGATEGLGFNPWSGSSGMPVVSGVVRVGELDRVLSLAQATGHITAADRDACFNPHTTERFVSDDMSSPSGVDRAPLSTSSTTLTPSLQLIGAAKRYDEAHSAVLATSLQSHRAHLAGATRDFTDAADLDQKLDVLRNLSAHLSSIQNHIARLEARYHGDIYSRDHFYVEAEHQADFLNLVTVAGESLSGINEQVSILGVAQRAMEADPIPLNQTVLELPRQIQEMAEHLEALKKNLTEVLDS